MKDAGYAALMRDGVRKGKDAGIQGWVWFMDTCKNKKDMLSYGLSQLRKYLMNKMFEHAIEFCHR
jgi:hypothetical protein